MSEDKGKMGCLLALFGVLSMPAFYVLDGLVVKALWHWFIVAKFSAPELRIPEAIGITITLGFMCPQRGKENREPLELLGGAILGPLIVLFVGWIVHAFI